MEVTCQTIYTDLRRFKYRFCSSGCAVLTMAVWHFSVAVIAATVVLMAGVQGQLDLGNIGNILGNILGGNNSTGGGNVVGSVVQIQALIPPYNGSDIDKICEIVKSDLSELLRILPAIADRLEAGCEKMKYFSDTETQDLVDKVKGVIREAGIKGAAKLPKLLEAVEEVLPGTMLSEIKNKGDLKKRCELVLPGYASSKGETEKNNLKSLCNEIDKLNLSEEKMTALKNSKSISGFIQMLQGKAGKESSDVASASVPVFSLACCMSMMMVLRGVKLLISATAI